MCVTCTVCWLNVFLNIWNFSTTVLPDVNSASAVICQFQPLWWLQGDPGFPKKNDEDNCFLPEENVYQQIGYRKNRGALLMWFRARLGTSHKTDSFALQKYMGWIARRFNGESARHYFQPCFTYSLLFVKRPLRHSMARCHARWSRCRGDWKSSFQLQEASGDKARQRRKRGRRKPEKMTNETTQAEIYGVLKKSPLERFHAHQIIMPNEEMKNNSSLSKVGDTEILQEKSPVWKEKNET